MLYWGEAVPTLDQILILLASHPHVVGARSAVLTLFFPTFRVRAFEPALRVEILVKEAQRLSVVISIRGLRGVPWLE